MSGDDPQPVGTGLRSSPDMRLATTQVTAPRDEEYEISGLGYALIQSLFILTFIFPEEFEQ